MRKHIAATVAAVTAIFRARAKAKKRKAVTDVSWA
ncbi:hypothetical protein LPJGGPFB_01240 [Ensifer adhaerens]|uniref:Uncharacterized protein n=1 Tax=Ensifer adhaerens TaxID=106592 RepID=A0ACC5SP91_ENSAD|nr:hypothetical protein [Ensifer adhaerens]NRP18012.1 hypothetical protein [Ensifer adhaerens]